MASQDTTEVLDNILDRFKSRDPVNTRSWFEDLMAVQFSGGLLEIACQDEAKAQFLYDNCLVGFTKAAQNATGHLVSIKFSVLSGEPAPKQLSETAGKKTRLHPDYTFESFVVGPCNRLAHASCVAVSNALGTTYNPLFLYGNVGLGKTHLLHAICHEAKKTLPAAEFEFLSCEEFVNSFVRAIEKGSLARFQSQFRNVDILVIDDVQFLREREQSQEEFFHTFNALYNNHKQIVLTADCPPGQLPSLEDRLISRFKWGLVTRLDAPSYETRIAIVQKKAHLRGLSISEDIAEYVAHKVKANIREMEGALTIIYATAQACDEPITLELAQQALGHNEIAGKKQISITAIIDAVTEYFDVRLADLQSKRRSQSITLPRQVCMFLARNLTRHSLEEIGGHLGGRDHTTVLHACSKIGDLKQNDPDTRAQLEELTAAITDPK
ncbi:MAG: chromosomal replication initiator protein DnaA [Planctomycetes bacterium]|nr:chromosomal replication initiator protein DnaA [Planctomycetota bacterium]